MSCRDEGLCFGGLRLMLEIELVSKWEICWALWSLVLFDLIDDSNNVAWFLMGDFFRLIPWSGGLGRQVQVGMLMDKPLGSPGTTPPGNFF